MKDLGSATHTLGMNITQKPEEGIVEIDQTDYLKRLLEKFHFTDANSVSTPMDPSIKFPEDTERDEEALSKIPYQEAIGSLLYAAQISRPDLAHSVSFLSRFNKNFSKCHWNAVKRLLRYVKGSLDLKLQYRRDGNQELIGFTDSDWGNVINDRYSITGSCFKLQGALISWSSKKQPTIALSSTEAEYMALSNAVQEALWLQKLISEFNSNYIKNPIKIYCDNMGAIAIGQNQIISNKSEHIEKGNVIVEYLPSGQMPADILTKPLTKPNHDKCVVAFGMRN